MGAAHATTTRADYERGLNTMTRKPTDRLLMLVSRWDGALPHTEIPEQLKPLCEAFITSGEGRLVNGVWMLTPTGFARSMALLDEAINERP